MTIGWVHALVKETAWKYRGVDLLGLSQEWLGCNGLRKYDRLSPSNILKLFSVGLLFKRLTVKGPSAWQEGEVLYFYDINNAPMTQILQRVQRLDEASSGSVISNESVRPMLDQKDSAYNILRALGPFGLLRGTLTGLRITARMILRPRHFFWVVREQPVGALTLFLNIMESVMVVEMCHRFLAKHKPKRIVVSTDCHKISRALVLSGRQFGIKSYVVQHGATGTVYAMLPIVADRMLAWGDHSKRWFLNQGEPVEKIEVVGCPRMDDLHATKIERGARQVLMVLNPIGNKNVADFTRLTVDALNLVGQNSGLNLLVKLHPSVDDDKDLVVTALNDLKLPYTLEKSMNIHDLIRQSMVVISTYSTVCVEAITQGVPAINVCVNGFKLDLGLEEYNCMFEVDTSKELADLLIDESKLHSLTDQYDYLINDYFYALDGESSQRAVAAMNH